MTATKKDLVLAIHPTSRGFGWVVFEGSLAPVDLGVAYAKQNRHTRLLARFERLLNRYEAAVLVLEQFDDKTNTGERIQQFCRAAVDLAQCRGTEVRVLRHSRVKTCFASMGAVTRMEIAQAVGQRLEMFRTRLPHVRKRWQSDDGKMGLFNAAAAAITYFSMDGGQADEQNQ